MICYRPLLILLPLLSCCRRHAYYACRHDVFRDAADDATLFVADAAADAAIRRYARRLFAHERLPRRRAAATPC